MARVRIVAHSMHESEKDAALAACDRAELQGQIVVGDIDENDISGLENKGLFVQRVGAPTPPAEHGRLGATRLAPPAVRELLFGASARRRPLPSMGPSPTPAEIDVYLVDLDGPLLEPARRQLDALAVPLLEKVGPFRWTVRARLESVPA